MTETVAFRPKDAVAKGAGGMLSVICFSKDRPMQLQAYLDSLQHFGAVEPGAISVLAASSSGIDYDLVKQRATAVRWIDERSFRDDLLSAVEQAGPYILFGCDDVVFKHYFDPNEAIALLQRAPEVFGVSLRMGANVDFVPRLHVDGALVSWAWREARGEYWRYPWEVSATIYRRDTVLALLRDRADLTNPNRLEAYIANAIAAGDIEVPPRLACPMESCCLTVTVNRVQDEFPNAFDDAKETDPADLFARYRDGWLQDWTALQGQANGCVHVGAEAFVMARQVTPPTRRYVQAAGSHTQRSSQIGLTIRFWWWRCLTLIWETMRKVMPATAIAAIKRGFAVLGIR